MKPPDLPQMLPTNWNCWNVRGQLAGLLSQQCGQMESFFFLCTSLKTHLSGHLVNEWRIRSSLNNRLKRERELREKSKRCSAFVYYKRSSKRPCPSDFDIKRNDSLIPLQPWFGGWIHTGFKIILVVRASCAPLSTKSLSQELWCPTRGGRKPRPHEEPRPPTEAPPTRHTQSRLPQEAQKRHCDAAGVYAMAVAGFLGRAPATAWRTASKAPGPGARVAGGGPGGVRKASSRGSRVCRGVCGCRRSPSSSVTPLGHARLGLGRCRAGTSGWDGSWKSPRPFPPATCFLRPLLWPGKGRGVGELAQRIRLWCLWHKWKREPLGMGVIRVFIYITKDLCSLHYEKHWKSAEVGQRQISITKIRWS